MHSLDARKATGVVTNTIPADKSALKEVVFKLIQTGQKIKLTIQVIDPEQAKIDAALGPVIDHAALKKNDIILHSLDSRKVAAGDVKNVLAADKNAPKEVLFKLRQTGEKLVVADIVVAIDPDEARRIAAEGPKLSKADIAKMAKEDGI
jgi:hypothetical protein